MRIIICLHTLSHLSHGICIKVSFLPIRHTLEDIDQPFSKRSERLRSTDSTTLSDFLSVLKQKCRSEARVIHMKSIANWSRPCEKGRVLKLAGMFSHVPIFISLLCRLTSREPDGVLVTCKVKVEWKD